MNPASAEFISARPDDARSWRPSERPIIPRSPFASRGRTLTSRETSFAISRAISLAVRPLRRRFPLRSARAAFADRTDERERSSDHRQAPTPSGRGAAELDRARPTALHSRSAAWPNLNSPLLGRASSPPSLFRELRQDLTHRTLLSYIRIFLRYLIDNASRPASFYFLPAVSRISEISSLTRSEIAVFWRGLWKGDSFFFFFFS